MVRNDSTSDEKKFLGIDLSIKKAPDNYIANNIDKKKEQLWKWLNNVTYIVAFIELHLQGYRIVKYSDWSYMLKWLSNPEYHRIDKYLNNGNENFVRSSEYTRYKCKLAGKHYQYNLLDIDYYKTGNISINGEYTTIDFSDSNNNCKYVQRIFQTIDSLFK